jgi:aryl carrier-like protein
MLADHALGQQLANGQLDRGHPDLASLRLVLMSGDWIPVDLPDRLWSVAPGVELVSLGGATEAAIWSIAYDIRAVDPAWESIPYGRPLRNQTMHVYHDRLQECPSWVTGELYIGGIGVAEGYWGDPDRTAASFITHPDTGERLYRTGDMGRRRPDGVIEFLGREDAQVKIGGFRIELGDIEAAVSRTPGVASAVAAAQGPDRQHRRLVGYLVPADGQERSAETDQALIEGARREAEDSLPAYMVPGTFVVIDQVPLSSNGKVNRDALPDPAAGAQAGPHVDAGPVAAALAEVICEVVGVAEVGPDDNFFALGGDSIAGVQVVAQATARGLPVTPADLFGAPTIRALAELAGARISGQEAAAADVDPTPAQVELLGRADGDGLRAAHWVLAEPPAGLEIAAAATGLQQLQDRWPALRQRWAGDRLTVASADADDCYVPLITLGPLPAARRAAAVHAMVTEMCGELDATQGPVAKAALFDLGDGQRRLGLVTLDLVCDGPTWPALLSAFTGSCLDSGPASDRYGPDQDGVVTVEGDGAAVRALSAADTEGLLTAAADRYRLTAAEVTAVTVVVALLALDATDVPITAEYDLRDVLGTDQAGPYSRTGDLTVPPAPDLAGLITAVKAAYRAGTTTADPSGTTPAAALLVRHLGPLPAALGIDGPVRKAGTASSEVSGAEVSSWLAGERLFVAVSGDVAGPDPSALAEALVAACRQVREHCQEPGTGSVDPSDFPLADLSQDELDAFLAARPQEVEEA